MIESAAGSHRRRNPLTGQWVLVSPQRLQRPWQGLEDAAPTPAAPAYDAHCTLCAGNPRASGARNPPYAGVFVFDNDFPALAAAAPSGAGPALLEAGLFEREAATGACRVICFSPDHGRPLPLLAPAEVERVVDAWCEQSRELGQRWTWVQVFENKGAMMGCSLAHPHGQVWACGHLPAEAETEDRHQRDYHLRHGRPLLLDYARAELERGERIVFESANWVALVPYWASWPFEVLLLPKFAVQRLPQLGPEDRAELAAVVRRLTTRYDNLFSCSFPYSMGWHGAPFVDGEAGHWQLHAHYYPPLLRSAQVRKFMVGFEMLAEPQRDLTAEQAAARLRSLSERHYGET